MPATGLRLNRHVICRERHQEKLRAHLPPQIQRPPASSLASLKAAIQPRLKKVQAGTAGAAILTWALTLAVAAAKSNQLDAVPVGGQFTFNA